MDIPDNYKVLFLQGGASTQFAMVPLNLFSNSKKADFVNTGVWSKKAISEAKIWYVNIVASSEDSTFNYIPELDESKFSKDADYFHITLNNTIYGTRYTKLPDTGNVPLVTDASSMYFVPGVSCFKFGLIYAGAQKNIGPAGLDHCNYPRRPDRKCNGFYTTMLNYKIHADNGSMYNTPPTFAIYMAMLVFRWLKDWAVLPEIEKYNIEKANLLI
jgi:phosphoserine aminotransferase